MSWSQERRTRGSRTEKSAETERVTAARFALPPFHPPTFPIHPPLLILPSCPAASSHLRLQMSWFPNLAAHTQVVETGPDSSLRRHFCLTAPTLLSRFHSVHRFPANPSDSTGTAGTTQAHLKVGYSPTHCFKPSLHRTYYPFTLSKPPNQHHPSSGQRNSSSEQRATPRNLAFCAWFFNPRGIQLNTSSSLSNLLKFETKHIRDLPLFHFHTCEGGRPGTKIGPTVPQVLSPADSLCKTAGAVEPCPVCSPGTCSHPSRPPLRDGIPLMIGRPGKPNTATGALVGLLPQNL
ncbi:hypothetical protein CH63R_01321 [Colletotrichum higginsianum IMI 349063]|uniref:Uncharacterized protein n=1 Tax=Colletotrichum higginsianum (strain IMI 349063) TaxID=759273 RepID=A0A1B7YVR3_COLHI|nr:hypothetical protein CH63R_01321 [Colletotrichum higginsianum IMI 349063]OBR16141.1 hypothetical protein CH63R_01321 [Colletotrichum higginsianum IMI 349063]